MRRLYLRWLGLLVFVVVLGVTFVNLGEWQLRRLDQRRESNATVIENSGRAPVPYADVDDRPVTDADEWQQVTVTGTFDGDQFIVRYRSNDDLPGVEVVAPLTTTDGTQVLIDRGFLAVGRGEPIPASAPPLPDGEVTLTAHLRPNETGRENAMVPVEGQMRLINSDALGTAVGHPLADGYLSVVEIDPPQEGEFIPISLPELSEGPHLGYALQWFLFAGIAVVGLVVFIRGDIVERRRTSATDTSHQPSTSTEQEH